MNSDTALCQHIDLIAANTWPSETSTLVEHWLLRASRGVTKRANSVLAINGFPSNDNWLEHIEQFYQSKGLPAAFHVSSASPEGLDELLASQGYVLDTPCLLMIASSQYAAEQTSQRINQRTSIGISASCSGAADTEWLDAFLALEQLPEERRTFYRGLFDRMPDSKGFVKLEQDGQIIALGTAIVEGDWAGFVNVVVHENFRGRGISYLLMDELTKWSIAQGAVQQYLQVITSNKPAIHLYEKLGYQPRFGYHYRVKNDLPSFASS
ncbi:putative N-acetyltransferase YobR [Paenibacillus marchantiophytorum]|uniref:N-acetyltransferase YobR n=1 Tax=Paenibacillus marchantiophytorum TaxID=1619310 RepID=A0ABQ1EW84_9BACL|nr:GNAT family N-acetyltransferase [Paenibacillus marchantiophytorum]GFZ90194.1 putative N-acetyltransferase YobR [Paenibacillus marchantiophytorum]